MDWFMDYGYLFIFKENSPLSSLDPPLVGAVRNNETKRTVIVLGFKLTKKDEHTWPHARRKIVVSSSDTHPDELVKSLWRGRHELATILFELLFSCGCKLI
jgi:hypothetical protein